MGSNGNTTTTDTPAATEPVKKINVGTLAATAFDDLTEELILSVCKDSTVKNIGEASRLYNVIESQGNEWVAASKRLAGATRKGAIAYCALRELVVDKKGEPVWAAQANPKAWQVVFGERFELSAMDKEDRDSFIGAIKKYASDRGLMHATMAMHAVNTNVNLGNEKVTYTKKDGTEATVTVKDALTIALGDDANAAIELDGAKLPKKTAAKVESMRKAQAKRKANGTAVTDDDGNVQYHSGYTIPFTAFGKVSKPDADNDGGSGGSGGAGNVGHETYKSAVDKIVAFGASDHWNALQAVKWQRETANGTIGRLIAKSQVKDRKKVVDEMRALVAQWAIAADFIEGAGKVEHPTKDEVIAKFIGDDEK